MTDFSEGSYERVMALRRAYRERLSVAPKPNTDVTVPESEGAKELVKEEMRHRSRIECEESDEVSIIMDRWKRRCQALAFEFDILNKRERKSIEADDQRHAIQEQLYREQFMSFWNNRNKQNIHTTTDVSKLLLSAYKYNVVPFATDPVECWERGIVIPPELQQNVEISDSEGTVSLPPFHELSIRYRNAYYNYCAEKTGFMIAQEAAVVQSMNHSLARENSLP